MKTRILTILYFISGILFIALENHTSLLIQFILKALLIPWLIVIFSINVRPFISRINILMLAGLVFSWAGDMALQYSFIPGLALFLTAHIMYLAAFFLTPGKNTIFSSRLWLVIPVLLYGVILVLYLFRDLGEMKLPVMIYAVIILIMLAGAINRIEKVNKTSFRMVLAGAALFVISDSAIAVNKFTMNFDYSGLIIMSTYLAAQFLITAGYILQYRKNFN